MQMLPRRVTACVTVYSRELTHTHIARARGRALKLSSLAVRGEFPRLPLSPTYKYDVSPRVARGTSLHPLFFYFNRFTPCSVLCLFLAKELAGGCAGGRTEWKLLLRGEKFRDIASGRARGRKPDTFLSRCARVYTTHTPTRLPENLACGLALSVRWFYPGTTLYIFFLFWSCSALSLSLSLSLFLFLVRFAATSARDEPRNCLPCFLARESWIFKRVFLARGMQFLARDARKERKGWWW